MVNSNMLQQFAAANGLDLKENVFHGDVGVEFRMNTRAGVFCVGFIAGKDETEVYTRKLTSHDVMLHERFWPLGSILSFFGYRAKGGYNKIRSIQNSEFNSEGFIALAEKLFGDAQDQKVRQPTV